MTAATTRITALWLCDAQALEAEAIVAALKLLLASASEAREKWPRVYGDLAGLRLVCPAAQAVSQVLTNAAQTSGCVLLRVAAPLNLLTAQCDLAVVTGSEDVARAGLLPTLVISSSAEPAFAFCRGAANPLLADVRRNDEPFSAATPALIAAAALGPPRGAQEARKLGDYLAEKDDARVARHDYDLLLRLIGQRSEIDGSPDASWERAEAIAKTARPGARDAVEGLRAACARADALALAYGKRWRSTLVSRSLLLLLASVGSGLIGALLPALSVVTIPFQAAATLLIFIDGRHAQRNRWRQKWIDYRRLAESVRVGRFLALCGDAPTRAGGADWVDWFTRRAGRAAAPFDALEDSAAAPVLEHLVNVEIAEQIAYHRNAYHRFRRLDRQFRRAAIVALFAFFALGALLAALALAPHLGLKLAFAPSIGLALSAAPALYATINGVRRDLDVVRQGARSAEIAAGLKRLARVIADQKPTAEIGRAAGLRAAEVMRDDLSSWQSVVEVL